MYNDFHVIFLSEQKILILLLYDIHDMKFKLKIQGRLKLPHDHLSCAKKTIQKTTKKIENYK